MLEGPLSSSRASALPRRRAEPAATSESYELLVASQAGDRDAFERLLRYWDDRLRAAAHRRIGPALRRHMDSRDLVQDAMAEIVVRFPKCRFSREKQFVAWMRTILSSKATDHARRIASNRSWLQSHRGRVRAAAADRETPSRNLIRREDKREIEAALSLLDARHRDVIRLRDIEDLGYEEVAMRLGLATTTATRMLRHRAWVHLIRAIERRRGSG